MKEFAFTLSEVLITLGIIGVVAAMTIPTLIANTQSSKYRNQYKKTLSTLNQAVKMNEANYDFNFNSAGQACNRTDNPDSILSVCAIFIIVIITLVKIMIGCCSFCYF